MVHHKSSIDNQLMKQLQLVIAPTIAASAISK
jgi:hypothetical protein